MASPPTAESTARRVERDDAGTEAFAFRIGKTGLTEQRAHGFALGELLDGIAEVVVGGFFPGEKGGDAGKDMVEIRAVDPAERRGCPPRPGRLGADLRRRALDRDARQKG